MRLVQSSFLLLIVLATGCAKHDLDPVNYVKWVESPGNGLRVNKVIGSFEYTLQYKPVDYVVACEEKTARLQMNTVTDRREDLKGMEYFTLRLSSVDKTKDVMTVEQKSADEYYLRTNYFSFDLQNDISLVEGKDTLNCALFNFVRNYGLAPYVDFVLGFPLKEKNENMDREFILEDKVLGNGIIKMTIDKSALNALPQLKTY